VDIEIRHLRYFVAVAESAGFTAAARRLHVAQQVLSAQIRQLEDAVGAVLFERTNRGASLTPAGDAFLLGARETIRSLDRAVGAARRHSASAAGRLAVGLSVAAGGELPTRVMADFAAAHPDVDVQLSTFELDHPAAGLLDYRSDIAFVRLPVVAAGIEVEELACEPRVFVLPSGHPLAGLPAVGTADVSGQPWIAAPAAVDGCLEGAWRDDWLGSPRPDGAAPVIGAVARTIDEWREHVVAGKGISLCPASAEVHYARPGLAFVPAVGVPPARLALAWRSDDTSTLITRFRDVARESAAPSTRR
jgi:DNA-binding transcriptional LysR family regulator